MLIAAIEGQIAQPLLVGRRLEVNPLLIFLALWFGGLYWGVAGVVLVAPFAREKVLLILVCPAGVAEGTYLGQGLFEA